MRHAFQTVFVCLMLSQGWLAAQKTGLVSGPMLGHVDHVEATIWVQTHDTAEVVVKYERQGEARQESRVFHATQETYFTAHVLLTDLADGATYSYTVWVNGKKAAGPFGFTTQKLWKWRTPPPEIRFAIGSCNFVNDETFDRPGRPYGARHDIFNTIADQKPDFMIWLGDNVYFREGDFNSETRLNYRHRRDRALPEMQRLLAATAHYAIWDDHDYGPNDSDRSYPYKDAALKLFKLYYANPHWGMPDTKGIFGKVSWADCDFFLMDCRYHRAPNRLKDPHKPYYGKAQLQWLKDQLSRSRANFKFIVNGNQMINTYCRHEAYAGFSSEYHDFINWLDGSEIPGVVILSGDRHYTELLRRQRAKNYPLYEFTSSPLTSGLISDMGSEADNPMRVPGTLLTEERNFGLIEVTGNDRRKRTLTLKAVDADGKVRWEHTIESAELRKPRPKPNKPKFPAKDKKKK
ncbi:alkaline phosphatase D family protein [Acanthopleuribacter pedis]|nr:alkaline phosphatase D family protein [Acanthopleuribacter pedis]